MYDTYVNAVLSEQALNGNSLMTAYSYLNEKLDKIDVYKRQPLITIMRCPLLEGIRQ